MKFCIESKMRKNTNNLTVFFGIILVFTLFISNYSSFNVTGNNVFNYNADDNNNILSTQDFSKDDFSSILKEEKNSLGNVSILDISYNKTGFYNSSYFSDLYEEYDSSALKVTYLSSDFMETTEKASQNFLNNEYTQNLNIFIKLNDTIEVNFNDSADPDPNGLEGYVIYVPRLGMEEVLEVYINDTKINEEQYSIKQNFLYFHYFEYYNYVYTKETFIMNIIYTYKVILNNWEIYQTDTNNLDLDKSSQEFTSIYNYSFTLQGNEYKDYGPTTGTALAEDLVVSLNISLYDRDYLNDFNIEINEEQIEDLSGYVDVNKNVYINLTDNFQCNNSEFSLEFETNFTIKFLDPVDKTWAIDRLVNGRYIRERIYFPSVISGPDHLLFKFSFFESTILFDDLQSSYSLFGRSYDIIDVNETEDSPIDTGIKIITPSLIKGETASPLSIQYYTDKTVRLIITDNINMPIWDISVKVYYYDSPFGTYISNNRTQPISPLIPNENGEIVLNCIPLGEYNIEIYQKGSLIDITFLNITTFGEEIYYIHTNIFQFPIVILVFGLSSFCLFSIGFIIYLKNKKRK